jgi:hypothetical protein
MTDIVERLRIAGDRVEGRPYSDMHEAADEIERLRADNKHWQTVASQGITIERELRAAVQRIDGINDNPAIYNPDIEAVVRGIYKRAGK